MTSGPPSIPAPRLTVVVVFHNMRREARRTLYSLTSRYQRNVAACDYEVIAIDNASDEPLEPATVSGIGANFHYIRRNTPSRSPCGALNYGVQVAKAPLVMCLIDGARILSPGILQHVLRAAAMDEHPFIYTLAMHLGDRPQYYLVEEGYNQEREDDLLRTVDWESNGYRLFDISCVAGSSGKGFFSQLKESNCFAMKTDDYVALGGFNPRFESAGGGLANLDFFNIVHETDTLRPIMLLGEATFHQFHGGVASNTPISQHPWHRMLEEYEIVKGQPFASAYRRPEYLGSVSKECKRFLLP